LFDLKVRVSRVKLVCRVALIELHFNKLFDSLAHLDDALDLLKVLCFELETIFLRSTLSYDLFELKQRRPLLLQFRIYDILVPLISEAKVLLTRVEEVLETFVKGHARHADGVSFATTFQRREFELVSLVVDLPETEKKAADLDRSPLFDLESALAGVSKYTQHRLLHKLNVAEVKR